MYKKMAYHVTKSITQLSEYMSMLLNTIKISLNTDIVNNKITQSRLHLIALNTRKAISKWIKREKQLETLG